ncbi:hypothetical protein D3C87_1769550 [compost metagenome]
MSATWNSEGDTSARSTTVSKAQTLIFGFLCFGGLAAISAGNFTFMRMSSSVPGFQST